MPWTDISQLSRGDVVLVRFPFTDLSGEKRRPAILLTDTTKVVGLDGLFVFTGTQLPPAGVRAVQVRRGSADAQSMGLRFPPGADVCFIYPSKIAALEVGLVLRKLGVTPPAVLQQIEVALKAALGL